MGCSPSTKTDSTRNMNQPRSGNLANRTLTPVSHILQSVVKHCNIQPHHFVLKMDFNTGHGFTEVFKQFKGGTGRVIGTDTSDKKIKKVKNEFYEEINYSILELTKCTSDSTPFISDMFECIFSVNGIYTWTDLDKTMKEIYRILRPGCVFVSSIQDYKEVTKNFKRAVKTMVHMIDDFIQSLKKNGFVKIRLHEHRDSKTGSKYEIVKAFTPLVKKNL